MALYRDFKAACQKKIMLSKTQFFRAENNPSALPQSGAEVLFVGRSNVGKSSVINALCKQKKLAITSKTPGRTRSINVYSAAMKKWLIDLPGYGFAKIAKAQKDLWQAMIEDCIVTRKSKKRVYVIIDAYVGPTELDEAMASWLHEYDISYKIIVNKVDKVPAEISVEDIKLKTVEMFEIDKNDVFPVSAKTKTGFEKLRTDIVSFLKL
ncbi:MAG: ribosome biogenesis GTP-binding protein YihA/YsxC [Elusimicrobiota bacterium]|jgi:GTP-binding protein|nr:ribosome biogenesis GTP-binding protein YihA/YsxC [Elusimicrobiota bacterium]